MKYVRMKRSGACCRKSDAGYDGRSCCDGARRRTQAVATVNESDGGSSSRKVRRRILLANDWCRESVPAGGSRTRSSDLRVLRCWTACGCRCHSIRSRARRKGRGGGGCCCLWCTRPAVSIASARSGGRRRSRSAWLVRGTNDEMAGVGRTGWTGRTGTDRQSEGGRGSAGQNKTCGRGWAGSRRWWWCRSPLSGGIYVGRERESKRMESWRFVICCWSFYGV